MKKTLAFLFIISLLALPDLYCQSKDYDNSICWEIKSSKTSKPSYILGSVHVLDTTKIEFPIQKIKELVDDCGCFCNEINNLLQDSAQMRNLAKNIFLPNKMLNFEDSIGEDYYGKLIQIVDSSKGSLKAFKPILSRIRPGFISFMVTAEKQTSNSELYTQSNFTMDSYFEKYASSKSYGIHALETAQKQIDMIIGGTYGESILDLKTSIDDFYSNDSIDMMKNYLNQNLKLLKEKVYLDSTMISRNRAMADGIERLSRKATVFVVIGAAHLPYQYGVLNILAQRGYFVKPYLLKMTERKKK